MSTIGGIDSSLINYLNKLQEGSQSRQDPAEKFKELDSDSSSTLDITELSTLALELSKMTGNTLEVEDAITSYDTDGDSQLSQEETMALIRDFLGPPPEANSEAERAAQAYLANSNDDKISVLMEMFEELRQAQEEKAKEMHELRFTEMDSDSSGGLNGDELAGIAEKITEKSGTAVSAEELLAEYDSDEDGEINSEELEQMMQARNEKHGPPPPPPPLEELLNTSGSRIADLLDQYLQDDDSEAS